MQNLRFEGLKLDDIHFCIWKRKALAVISTTGTAGARPAPCLALRGCVNGPASSVWGRDVDGLRATLAAIQNCHDWAWLDFFTHQNGDLGVGDYRTARVYHMIYCCVFKQWHSSWINKLGLDGSFGQWALEHHHCSYKWVVFHGDVKIPEGRVVVDDLLYLYTIKTYSFWYGDGNPWMQFCPQNCQTLAEWQGGSRMNLHGYSRFWVVWSGYSHKHDVNIVHGTMGLHGTNRSWH